MPETGQTEPSQPADKTASEPAPPVLTDTLSAKPSAKPAKRGGGFTLFVALLALALGGASAAWQGYQYWLQTQANTKPWHDDIRVETGKIGESLAAEQSRSIKALTEEMEQRSEALRQTNLDQQVANQNLIKEQGLTLTVLEQKQKSIEEQLAALARLNRDDWKLAEAEYLIRLAQQRLLLGASITGTSPLLESARQNLQAVHDAGAQAVLEILNRDIEALGEASQFDLPGLYDQIATVAENAQQLEPLADHKVKMLSVQAADEPAPEFSWRSPWPTIRYGLRRAGDLLNAYIRVSDRDTQYQQTIIAGGQRELFQQNLQLLFEQAQWSVLSGNRDLFEKTLSRSEEWLHRYYRSDKAAAAVLEQLATLKQKPIRPTTPSLSGSLDALRMFIDERHNSGGSQ